MRLTENEVLEGVRCYQAGGKETRSGTEKRCSHNLQSGHPAWWSADNYSIFPIVNILEASIGNEPAEEIRNA